MSEPYRTPDPPPEDPPEPKPPKESPWWRLGLLFFGAAGPCATAAAGYGSWRIYPNSQGPWGALAFGIYAALAVVISFGVIAESGANRHSILRLFWSPFYWPAMLLWKVVRWVLYGDESRS